MSSDALPKFGHRQGELSRKGFLDYVREQIKYENGLYSLPLCLSLLVLFAAMVMSHEQGVSRQSIRSAVREDILENANYDYLNRTIGFKNMENVHQVNEVVWWLELGFFPHIIWNPNYNMSGTYLQYNKIVGGVRIMTQEVAESVEQCDLSLADAMSTPCLHETTDDTSEGIDDLAFPPDGEETTKWSAAPDFEKNGEQKYYWFLLAETEPEHRRKLIAMGDDGVFNRRVRHVMASMVMYNADLNLLCLVEGNFFFSRTGRVWPLLRIKTIDPTPSLVEPADVAFLFLLLVNFLKDIGSLLYFASKVGFRHLNKHLPHGIAWYVLDIIGLACGVVLACTYVLYYFEADRVGDLLVDDYEDMLYNEWRLANFVEEVEKLAHHWVRPYRQVLIVYPFSLMFRLGLAFTQQPRLSMVSRTMMTAFTDLYHYTIVFCSIMLCSTIFSLTMFGHELEQYSTLSRALQSCVRMLFGDADWDDLQKAGYYKAFVFFWVFHIVVVMIMFNILLTIIIDAYENMKEEVGKQPATIVEQCKQSWERAQRRVMGNGVTLYRVWVSCFEAYGMNMFMDDPFTLQELKKIVPKIPDDQAEMLFEEACSREQSQETQAGSSDLFELVSVVDGKMRALLSFWLAKEKAALPKRRIDPVLADVSRLGGSQLVFKTTSVALPGDISQYVQDPQSGEQRLQFDQLEGALRVASWAAEKPDSGVSLAVGQAVKLAVALAEGARRATASQDLHSQNGQANLVEQAEEVFTGRWRNGRSACACDC